MADRDNPYMPKEIWTRQGSENKVYNWLKQIGPSANPTKGYGSNLFEAVRPLSQFDYIQHHDDPDSDTPMYARGGPVLPRSGGPHKKGKKR